MQDRADLGSDAMTLEEMRQVLATIAGYDGRPVDARVIHDWHEILQAIPFQLALAAARAWYQENRGYVQPHDVAQYAARLAGLDRRESVTEQRLQNVRPAWELEGLAAPWLLPGRERHDDE